MESFFAGLSMANFAMACVFNLHALHQVNNCSFPSAGKTSRMLALFFWVIGLSALIGWISLSPNETIVILLSCIGLGGILGLYLQIRRNTFYFFTTSICAVNTAVLGLIILLKPSYLLLEKPQLLVGVHIASSIMGQILAFSACIVSALYLWQQYLLKRKMLRKLPGFSPSLEVQGRVLLGTIWAGFLFLTATVISGAIYSQYAQLFNQPQILAKFIWALCVWIWYIAILIATLRFHLSLKKTAQMSFVGLFLLAMAFFGLIFIP